MKNSKKKHTDEKQAIHVANHVTWVGFWWNILLGIAKVAGGIIGRSGALVADGIHSLSDVFTDVVILVMVGIARKKPDKKYQYGHGKYETFATMLLAVILAIVAIGIFGEAVQRIIDASHGILPPRPGMIALVLCTASIVVKEWLYHYTLSAGRKINSGAIIANAWHHRSDAFSSVATLLGVSGAMFLGPHWRILDPIAAIIVAIFIVIISVKIAIPAVKELLEIALPKEMENEIRQITASTPGVITYHHLRTRRNGNTIIIDMHIKVRPDILVVTAHNISSNVENRIDRRYGKNNTIVTIHIEPYEGEKIRRDGSCAE
ncbi:MAG: cation diffusion facilitator family transporter [Muribaculum sp.]|nr:cation diffusion facilitator family transporter [Muribaculaceae bacterium]MCM1081081.1 cation diffusion facilitator family transporter [Muribaculum sp.]